jgi:hypothetical protein
MVSKNLTFLSIPSSGTFLEIYDMSSYSTPLVVEYSGSSQSASSNLFSTANQTYSSAGSISTVYNAGTATLSSGLYTTKTYNLYTDTIVIRGNFFNRSQSGEYNEYWFAMVPSKNKYYHPIGTEASGNTPEGFVMGGWPTFWSARDRQSTSLGDNFFTSNITTPLKFNVWYTTTMEITRSGDSMFISKFEGKDTDNNSFTTKNKIFIGKVTSIHYARNTRLGILADDLLNWVEIITKKYECKITKKTVPKTCVNTKTIPLFNYFSVEGRTPTDSNAVLKVTNVSSTGSTFLLNKTLAKGIFPKNVNAGKYTILITTRCGSQDSMVVEILPNQSKLASLSDSVFCQSNAKITAGVKIINTLDSITNAIWKYPSNNKPNDVANGKDVLLNFSGNIGINKI